MTDYRRPDLDLWDEEEDVEDARPTIVSERPKNQPPELPEEATNARLRPAKESTARIATGVGAHVLTGDEVTSVRLPPLPSGSRALPPMRALSPKTLVTPPSAPKPDPEVAAAAPAAPSLTSTQPLPIVQDVSAASAEPPASEESEPELASRESGELLRNSEVSALQVEETPPPLPAAAAEEGELVGADEVEEVAAKEEPPKLMPRPVPVARDRDVTERISLPPAGFESIAPATHTVRPAKRDKREPAAWQLGLAAIALVAGGLGVSALRDMRGSGEPVATTQPERAERAPVAPEPTRQAASQPVAPPMPAESTLASSAARDEPAEPAPAMSSAPRAPSEPEPAATPAPSPAPQPANVEKPAAGKGAAAKGEPRRARPAAVATSEDDEADEDSAEPVADASGLPAKPSREQVSEVLNALVPELQKCVGDRGGEAEVTLTVRSAGLVSYSVVAGQYAGTPEGSCIARAVKIAKFPAFSQPSLRITYPFRL